MKTLAALLTFTILIAACGGGSSTDATSGEQRDCPLPTDVEMRIRQAYTSGLEPGHTIVIGGAQSFVRFTFNVGTGGANRFEDVDLDPCTAEAAQRLVDELSTR